jgi:modification methylase
MHKLPADCVDLVFADPPYNLQLQGDLKRPDDSRSTPVDDDWDQSRALPPMTSSPARGSAPASRDLKPSGTLWVIGSYHNIFRVGSILQDLGLLDSQRRGVAEIQPDAELPRPALHQRARDDDLGRTRDQGARYTFNYEALKAGNETSRSAPTGRCRCAPAKSGSRASTARSCIRRRSRRRCSPA